LGFAGLRATLATTAAFEATRRPLVLPKVLAIPQTDRSGKSVVEN
jgi:hypothetical protein